MGLSERSVVDNETELKTHVEKLYNDYHKPIIVEEFIQGREFTVGVLGNQPPYTLPITEIVFPHPRGIVLFSPNPETIPLYHLQGIADAALPQSRHRSICPAPLTPELQQRIEQTALHTFQALGCRDWCRIDMRLGSDDILYVLELNPIAGITPGYWLPRSAEVAGLSYQDFINAILNHAFQRKGQTPDTQNLN